MLELSTTNVIDYLRQQGWIGTEPADASALTGGVSNLVLRITTPHRCFVLKQSRSQLRTREDWFSDLDRIWREQEVMQTLFPVLPGIVPEVLHVDRPNYVYTMSHAPMDASVWKSDLLAGRIDIELGAQVGRVLGRMHQHSADQRDRFSAFHDHAAYVQLRVDPFYHRVRERRPEVAEIVASVIEEMLTRKEALCHGDYTPKNMLIHATRASSEQDNAGFTLVDYETAHVGDPTMDIGLFLAHLTLKAIRSAEHRDVFGKLIEAFWVGYFDAAEFRPQAELESRGLRHLGVCLLARVDGTSPVDYLDETRRGIARDLGRAILLDGMKRREDVLLAIATLPHDPQAPA